MRVYYILCAAALVAILAGVAMNVLESPIDTRRVALAADLRALEGAWEAPELNRGTSPARHEETITKRPEIWNHIVQRPKPKPQPFNIESALQGVQPTRQALGDRVQIRTPSNARGDWYRVGDQINGIPIVEITREFVRFSLQHTDGKTYTHSITR